MWLMGHLGGEINEKIHAGAIHPIDDQKHSIILTTLQAIVMTIITITSLVHYLSLVETIVDKKNEIVLFRGQMCDWPLLPSIARKDPKENTTRMEKEMLKDLHRRSKLLLNCKIDTKWEWLVLAQHKGLLTRLLDWTSNPLTALWFACQPCGINDACVYIIDTDRSLDVDQRKSPFKNNKTRIYKPILNNELVIAQDGWFTAHYYCKDEQEFIPLEKDVDMKDLITKVIIPHALKPLLIKRLSRLGTNSRTIYPGLEGLCKHLNWKYQVANSIK
ncbi:FRG domain-containing protein [Chitinophaga sp. SYP-B3965]|uniref:FRG domain-containing protein n=1 Tax=Chitinophaga sp. SYP-B3965 TaxID=2663120 RepID=UPI001299FBB9|nr:FRG domain-containing protein [Chitinophaga sp. SYP-B3965]MRG48810.1 FRG domain-containing protein [Chitinophaga sp. SYP-B3965]